MNAVVVWPDGCSRTLPMDEAMAMVAAHGVREGLRLFPSVPAYESPAELDRRLGGPRNRPPLIDVLTEEERQGVVAMVLQTSYRTAAQHLGCSKFTITRIMRRQGVSKRKVRAPLGPSEASA